MQLDVPSAAAAAVSIEAIRLMINFQVSFLSIDFEILMINKCLILVFGFGL